MLVRDQHAVEPVDFSIQKLLAAVGRGIDQQTRTLAYGVRLCHQQAAAAPAVLRIVRIAVTPAERDARHAHGRAAAEDRVSQTHAAPARVCGTLLNSRKKFSVVCRAICSKLTPRMSASTLAVSIT